MMKRMFQLVLLLGMIVVIAACSDGSSANGSDASADIRTIEVTTPPTSKNLSWQTPDGEIKGYEPDVLRAIDEKLEDFEFNIQAVADSAQETGLKTGKYDLNVGGFYPTPEREEQFLVSSEPTGVSLIKIWVREDSDVQGLQDLVEKKIVPFSASGATLNVVKEWQKENPEHELVLESSSGDIPYAERLSSVNTGQYDAFIGPANLGQNEIIEELDLDVRAIDDPIEIGETVVLIHNSEENKKLAEDVNNALKELREEGTLSEISMEYYGEDIFQYIE